METDKVNNPHKLPFLTKFFYGFGSLAYGIKDNAFNYFLLFVYVQVFGLAPNLAGLAILLMLVIDAISDPLIGYFSDKTQSKWGRRHPWMYASAIPVAISFFLIWDPPENLSQISDNELALALKENLNRWTKKYNSFVTIPLNEQNPVLVQSAKIVEENVNLSNYDFVDFIFQFDEKTFYLEGSGKTRYSVKMANGEALPSWLVFLPSQHTFVASPPFAMGSLDLIVEASNDITNISDTFTLSWNTNNSRPKNIPEEKINEDLLNELNEILEAKLKRIIILNEEVNEEQLDSLIAALNFKEQQNVEETSDINFDSSFKIKSKPKPSKKKPRRIIYQRLREQRGR